MKRLNPNTNQPFKRGDVREDGFLFKGYIKNRCKKDGTFVEDWCSPERFPNIKSLWEKEYWANQNRHKKRTSIWRKNNPDKNAAKRAKERSAKLQRTPAWDPDAHLIIAKYQLAAMLSSASGIPHHVDHIIPLQGKLVSGLHVFSNLRVIPGSDNVKKSNKFTV